MSGLFENILIMSITGFVLTALLLCLKPFTSKKFPASWQYYVWIAVLVSMTVPIYKLVPEREIQKIQYVTQKEASTAKNDMTYTEIPEIPELPPVAEGQIPIHDDTQIKIIDLLAFIWGCGVGVFILVVVISYMLYIQKRMKNSVLMEDNEVLYEVKTKLGIKRKIPVRMSPDIGSPMVVGVFFPVVYMPCKEMNRDMMRMVFLHELTHYKRKDLLIKWFALLVNAIHWFNPLSYILCMSLSEACEVSCDMKVTQNMNGEDKKIYMKTILELVEK